MDTIFAPICPLGGSIVSVRFSGEKAFKVLDLFQVPDRVYKNKDLFFTKIKTPNYLYKKNNIIPKDNNEYEKVLDEVIVKIFRKPNSFTGENVIEIDLHASKIILDKFLDYVSSIEDFRFAKNGEFSKRAFLNGKIDILKAEGINALIRAETEQQIKLANELFFGKTLTKYKNIREQLIHIKSLVEMNIDFSEEEVPKDNIEQIKTITNNLTNSIDKCIEEKEKIDKISNGIKIAIVGSPNVGKSSLLNWFAKREIAIVSPIKGTTRDVISTEINIDGYKVILFDTAGIRETEDEIEKEGVKRAKNVLESSDIRIFMFDNIKELEYQQKYFFNKNSNNENIHQNNIFVLNKIDINSDKESKYKNDKDNKDKYININQIVKISVLKEQGLENLLSILKQFIFKSLETNKDHLVFNERHRVLLQKTSDALKNIDFESSQIEIIAEDINEAIKNIGFITGEIFTDDILDNIFSKFCIGK